jgi:hypothetical protein
VDGDDGRVPQLGHAAGLAQEAVQFLRPGEVPCPRHLDGVSRGACKRLLSGASLVLVEIEAVSVEVLDGELP